MFPAKKQVRCLVAQNLVRHQANERGIATNLLFAFWSLASPCKTMPTLWLGMSKHQTLAANFQRGSVSPMDNYF